MEDLMTEVLQQIADDVDDNDFTAIEELLQDIPEDKLRSYLTTYN